LPHRALPLLERGRLSPVSFCPYPLEVPLYNLLSGSLCSLPLSLNFEVLFFSPDPPVQFWPMRVSFFRCRVNFAILPCFACGLSFTSSSKFSPHVSRVLTSPPVGFPPCLVKVLSSSAVSFLLVPLLTRLGISSSAFFVRRFIYLCLIFFLATPRSWFITLPPSPFSHLFVRVSLAPWLLRFPIDFLPSFIVLHQLAMFAVPPLWWTNLINSPRCVLRFGLYEMRFDFATAYFSAVYAVDLHVVPSCGLRPSIYPVFSLPSIAFLLHPHWHFCHAFCCVNTPTIGFRISSA